MENEKNANYKEQLEKERALLIKEIGDHEKPVDFGNDTEDVEEGTDKDEALNNEFAIARDLKNRLDEVDIALAKIYEGKFGNCEKCGKEMTGESLDNDPAIRLCKDCRAAA